MIGFNVQPLASENLTGIGNYANDVLKCLLPETSDYELHVFNFLGRNDTKNYISKHLGDKFDEARLHMVKTLPLSVYIRLKKFGRILPYKALTKSKSDVTVFFNYLCPEGNTGKNIITIYDMVCERFPETMDDRNRRLLKSNLQKSANNANAIVTISEFSKAEIIDTLKIPEEKIFVAPCGVDCNYYKPSASEEAVSEKSYLKDKWNLDDYILYVGTLEPRKNSITLVKAFNRIAKDRPQLKLVLAGGIGWHAEETLKAIEESPYKDRIVRTGYISNEEKRMLYRNTKVFVFPSLYEGFGMPVIEAMACGIPCVVANTSSLVEISGGLAPLIDVFDDLKFADSISEVLDKSISSEERDLLVANASKYTWEFAAKIYKDAIAFGQGV